MTNQPTRRQFLRQSVAAAAAISASSVAIAPRTQAIEPIRRDGKPAFKYSLAAYSYRDLLEAKDPAKRLSLEDFVNDCAALGLQGTELTSYYFPKDLTPDYLRSLRRHCFLMGLDVSGTAVGNDFCHPAGEKRDAEIAGVKQWVDNAAILGAPVIRIFSGHPHGTSTEEAHKLAVSAIEECCDYAGKHGVILALENHGGLTESPAGMLALVKDVRSPWFGVNLDTGNFHGSDPYADLVQLAPYAVNVQVKVSLHPAGGSRGPADMRRLGKMMADVGYRGYVVLEYEEPEAPREACRRYVDEMRTAFNAALAGA